MPLSNKERQRRYREKLKQNPEMYDENKKKKRENYHSKKRLIKDLQPQEKTNARIIWKLRKRESRQRKRNLEKILAQTPPSSPSIIRQTPPSSPSIIRMLPPELRDQGNNLPVQPNLIDRTTNKRGRKKLRKDQTKLYRENLKLKQEIENLKRQRDKFKKRAQRCHAKENKTMKKPDVDDSTKYKHLTNAIKDRYKLVKKRKEKNILKEIFENIDDSVRKGIVNESLGVTEYKSPKIKTSHSLTVLKKTISDFYSRDDITRATAGKKETVTVNGTRIQKRFLLDNMKNLYSTFMKENPTVKCSYFYFTSNKPKHVLKPSVSGREMCLCKTHINPEYKALALKNKTLIPAGDLTSIIDTLVCDAKSQSCMYGLCTRCCDLRIEVDKKRSKENINWQEWGRQEEVYKKDDKICKVFKNVKLDKKGKVKELVKAFNEELVILKKHVFNMKVQFKNFRTAVDNLQDTEVLIVADFSENYNCKYFQEIQAHHFGGSRQQVSLHTVVVYFPTNDNRKQIESFCTISKNTSHQPAAIWAHLEPVIKEIKRLRPLTTTIHFFTDGPFSQYRQKQNFYFAANIPFKLGFTGMTWSFFEAGHGKGPADGIGGYLKRSADDMVARGEDISTVDKFYEALRDVSKIRLYLIESEAIEKFAKEIPPNITALPGTRTVHQIYSVLPGELKYRILSCFCKRGFCQCYSPKVYKPIDMHCPHDSEIGHLIESGKDISTSEAVKHDRIDNLSTSSDEDQPLINYKSEILGLCKRRQKRWYDSVYKSDSDENDSPKCDKPGSSKTEDDHNIGCGDFLLVSVKSAKGNISKYVCVVNDLHDDGEIRVTFLRYVKNKKVFCLNKEDVSDIDYKDILEILPTPIVKNKFGETYFEFNDPVPLMKYDNDYL